MRRGSSPTMVLRLALVALMQEVKVRVSCFVTARVLVQMSHSQTLDELMQEAKVQVSCCGQVEVLHSYAAA